MPAVAANLPQVSIARVLFGYFRVLVVLSVFPWPSDGASVKRDWCPGGRSVVNAQCCGWFEVLDDLQANLFSYSCGEEALEAIRISFHDGIGRSRRLERQGASTGGGADGSILKFSDIELTYPENHPVDEIAHAIKPFADRHNVGYGDILQFAAAVALTNCPGAPRLKFFAGRRQANAPAPEGMVPSPADTAPTILARMDDAGFTADETVALLAAHSIGRQRTLDPATIGMRLDSTPEAFDTQIYLDVLLEGIGYPGHNGSHYGEAESPLESQFRIASDAAIARDPRTACTWQSLIDNQGGMTFAFREAMHKLALNGQHAAALVDCSEVIPESALWDGRVRFPSGTSPRDVEHSLILPLAPSESTSVLKRPCRDLHYDHKRPA